MVDVNVELMNVQALVRVIVNGRKSAMPALGRGLYEEGQIAFRNSQRQVPFHLGTLKGSGRLFQPEQTGNSVSVVLGYGGAARKYAQYTHDRNLNFRNGKKRYYLLDPVQERVRGFDTRLAKRIEQAIKKP